jgi:hypothetical protein
VAGSSCSGTAGLGWNKVRPVNLCMYLMALLPQSPILWDSCKGSFFSWWEGFAAFLHPLCRMSCGMAGLRATTVAGGICRERFLSFELAVLCSLLAAGAVSIERAISSLPGAGYHIPHMHCMPVIPYGSSGSSRAAGFLLNAAGRGEEHFA